MSKIYLLGPLSHQKNGGAEEYREAESCFLHEKNIETMHVHKQLVVEDYTTLNSLEETAVIHTAANMMLNCTDVVTLKDWEVCPIARRQMKLAIDLGFTPHSVVKHFPFGYERMVG